ncbi:nuclear transport factor 2 family protein [Avibacterium avium]|uniref:nuclear transport factor 2 family protein n=1 Tax=Avibacterium avium TaxID=751 RepID=UPI003BF874BA
MQSLADFIQDTTDRRQIRELIDNYAYFADQCRVQDQAELFTEDTVYIIDYLDNPQAKQTIIGKANLIPLFEGLTQFHTKTHFNGQSTLTALNADNATGIAYCLAHHITLADGKQTNMVTSIRYDDEYRKQDGKWLFAKRHLQINWVENR